MVPREDQELDGNLRSPLVAMVARRIVELIRAQGLVRHGLPSERKLAADLSVSRGIVRAALKTLRSNGLIESKPNCRPVVRADQFQRASKKHIAIWLWPNTSDYAAASILKGIQSSDLPEDVRLIVSTAPKGDWSSVYEAEDHFLRSAAQEPVGAGVILWYLGGDRSLEALRNLRACGVPMVFLDRLPPKGFSADFVGTNNESAAYSGVRHLLDLGHRRIALITNLDGASSVAERESGYLLALREAGLGLDEDLIQRDLVDVPAGVESALDALLNLPAPPTAIFCINDHLALQTVDALNRRQISVPEDISVLGFDGLLRWVPSGGYLTTLEQDFERMGRIAARLVIERMETGRPDAYTHLLLDAPLAKHGSTRSPRVSTQRAPTPTDPVTL